MSVRNPEGEMPERNKTAGRGTRWVRETVVMAGPCREPEHGSRTFHVEGIKRRIGRTRSPIVRIEKALDGRVLLVEKADGSIYALLSIDGPVTRIRASSPNTP